MIDKRKFFALVTVTIVCSLFLITELQTRGLLHLTLEKDHVLSVAINRSVPETTVLGRSQKQVMTSSTAETSKRTEDEATIWVMILSYQRTGSTFIGNIFNDAKRNFYIYEPLDPLYSAMYGVDEGWTVPSDVLSYRNGSLRSIPQVELDAVYWLMTKIYTCNMSSLPPAVLAHKFWKMFGGIMTHSKDYVKCLRGFHVDISSALHKCQLPIKKRCGNRFGARPDSMEQCRSFLWGDEHQLLARDFDNYVPKSNKYRRTISAAEQLPEDFRKYFSCLIKIEPALTKCAAEHMDKPCQQKPLRAIKTVRANIQTAERLLRSGNNTYLIHLYRDPRGAIRSRLKAYWSQGLANRKSTAHEAQLYCSQVLRDVLRRRQLEADGLAHRIKEVVYDGYVQEPLLNLLDIYHFIGQDAPNAAKQQGIKNRALPTNKNSQSIAQKWKKDMKPDDLQTINKVCSDFFNQTTFAWPS